MQLPCRPPHRAHQCPVHNVSELGVGGRRLRLVHHLKPAQHSEQPPTEWCSRAAQQASNAGTHVGRASCMPLQSAVSPSPPLLDPEIQQQTCVRPTPSICPHAPPSPQPAPDAVKHDNAVVDSVGEDGEDCRDDGQVHLQGSMLGFPCSCLGWSQAGKGVTSPAAGAVAGCCTDASGGRPA